MRISTERGAPGFREDALLLDIRITFNGKPVTNAVMADSDAGELTVMDRELVGETPVDWDARPHWGKVIHYKGVVEIIENKTERRL